MTLLEISSLQAKYNWTYEVNDPHYFEKTRSGNSAISPNQAHTFSSTGALVVRNAFSEEQVRDFLKGISEIRMNDMSVPEGSPKASKSYPGEYLRDIHKSSSKFHEILKNELVVGTIRHLLGPKIRLRAFSARSTFRSSDSRTRWHRDQRSSYFPTPPIWSDANDLSILLYLTPVSKKNGPLEVILGSHINNFNIDEGDVYTDAENATKVEFSAGDMMIMHSSLLHRAGHHESPQSSERNLLILHFGPSYYTPQQYINCPTQNLDAQLVVEAEADNDFELLELLTYSGHM